MTRMTRIIALSLALALAVVSAQAQQKAKGKKGKGKAKAAQKAPAKPAEALPALTPEQNKNTLRGAVYIPIRAYNAPQFWRDYCPLETRRDLGYAKQIRLNALRVWTSYKFWRVDPEAFEKNFDDFLDACEEAGMGAYPSLFENCGVPPTERATWGNDYDRTLCVNSPHKAEIAAKPERYGETAEYVEWFMKRYRDDKRILAIEIMNEPGKVTVSFAKAMLKVAVPLRGTVPLTMGSSGHGGAAQYLELGCDIIQYHNNFPGSREGSKRAMDAGMELAKKHGVPIWMAEWQRIRPSGAGFGKKGGGIPDADRYTFLASMAADVQQHEMGTFFWSLMVKPAYLGGQRANGTINGLFWPDGAVWSLEDARAVSNIADLELKERRVDNFAEWQAVVDETSPLPKGVEKAIFGQDKEGRDVHVYTLTNDAGMQARIMTRGAIVLSLTAPDRKGKLADIVLGHDTLDPYLVRYPYFGCVAGRVANRISYAKFSLEGKDYELSKNRGEHHLHGGEVGFDKVLWKALPRAGKNGPALQLNYRSPDGEEGYPGALDVIVTYELTNDNELSIEYKAWTDKKTPINLTQHSYFNLTGATRDILDHELMIDADQMTLVDDLLIPTGKLGSVKKTPFDFRKAKKIGARIEAAGDYDHNYVLNNKPGEFALVARLSEPKSGRVMEVLTDQPGLQFYSGNFLSGDFIQLGKGGKDYEKYDALCLETQHFPDSPNRPEFPSVILKPGETYQTKTVYRFSAK